MTYHVQFPGLGLELTLNRVAFSIGGFDVYWYGIIIAAGMLLAMAYAFRHAVDFGIDGDRLVDVVFVGVVAGVICARAYYVIFAPFEYESIWQMLDIRQGGLAIYGGVIGAFVFGGLAAKWRKVPILPLFDLVGVCFLIGQGVGRWANFINQEAFGTNTTLPWGMISEGTQSYLAGVQAALAAEGVAVDPGQPVHPTFLYESLWCLAGFALLALLVKRRRFHGQLFLGYIIWYGAGRFWIEGLRTDALMVAGTLRTSQLVALVSVLAAAVLMAAGLRRAKGKPLMVPLAVADIKMADGPLAVIPGSLPACASHAEFAKATAEMNREIAALAQKDAAGSDETPPADLAETANEPEAPAAESGSEQTADAAQPGQTPADAEARADEESAAPAEAASSDGEADEAPEQPAASAADANSDPAARPDDGEPQKEDADDAGKAD